GSCQPAESAVHRRVREVMFSRIALVLLMLAATVLPSATVNAHEASLGVLEIREMRAGAYVARWTMEPSIGASRVDLRLPSHCLLRMPQLTCGSKGLVGSITIGNLGANMSAVLIKIIPLSGESRSYTITTANPVVSILGTGPPSMQV